VGNRRRNPIRSTGLPRDPELPCQTSSGGVAHCVGYPEARYSRIGFSPSPIEHASDVPTKCGAHRKVPSVQSGSLVCYLERRAKAHARCPLHDAQHVITIEGWGQLILAWASFHGPQGATNPGWL
jgi:hypothetical protein